MEVGARVGALGQSPVPSCLHTPVPAARGGRTFTGALRAAVDSSGLQRGRRGSRAELPDPLLPPQGTWSEEPQPGGAGQAAAPAPPVGSSPGDPRAGATSSAWPWARMPGRVLRQFGLARVEDGGRRWCFPVFSATSARGATCVRPRSRADVSAGRGGRLCRAAHTRTPGVALTAARLASPPHRAPAPGAAGVTHGLAEEAVTQSWIPAASHPPTGHRGHVEPAGPASPGCPAGAGCCGSPSGCGERAGGAGAFPGPCGSLRGHGDAGAFGHSGWHGARPDSCPSWALGSGLGTFSGGVSGGASCAQPWLNLVCQPRAAVPGAAPSPHLESSPLRRGHLWSRHVWAPAVGWSGQPVPPSHPTPTAGDLPAADSLLPCPGTAPALNAAGVAPPAVGLPRVWGAAAAPPAPGAEPPLALGSTAAPGPVPAGGLGAAVSRGQHRGPGGCQWLQRGQRGCAVPGVLCGARSAVRWHGQPL